MTNNRFFIKSNIKVSEAISQLNLSTDNIDVSDITDLAPIEHAESGCLTFFINDGVLQGSQQAILKNTKAGFCLIKKNNLYLLPSHIKPIVSNNPYIDFLKLFDLVYKANDFMDSVGAVSQSATIAPNAIIENTATIHDNAIIYPFAYIGHGAIIGKNVTIYSNVHIGAGVQIGDNAVIFPNTSIIHSTVGDNCTIQSNVSIGNFGFGFLPKDNNYHIKHYGDVIIHNNVNIGSSTSIDRGTLSHTIVDDNVKIGNICNIGHNVHIGQNTLLTGSISIAGSTKIGKYCMIGGNSAFNGHIVIGDFSVIYAASNVSKSCPPNSRLLGAFPAAEYRVWVSTLANFYRLCKKKSNKDNQYLYYTLIAKVKNHYHKILNKINNAKAMLGLK